MCHSLLCLVWKGGLGGFLAFAIFGFVSRLVVKVTHSGFIIEMLLASLCRQITPRVDCGSATGS